MTFILHLFYDYTFYARMTGHSEVVVCHWLKFIPLARLKYSSKEDNDHTVFLSTVILELLKIYRNIKKFLQIKQF